MNIYWLVLYQFVVKTTHPYYTIQHFVRLQELTPQKRGRVLSKVKYEDLAKRLEDPKATVHKCKICDSTDFQLYEIASKWSRRVRRKLVANCLRCGQWYNLDKWTFRR
jgi:hypothetical protein